MLVMCKHHFCNLRSQAYGMGMKDMRLHPQRWEIDHYLGKIFQNLGKVYNYIRM